MFYYLFLSSGKNSSLFQELQRNFVTFISAKL